MPLRTATPAAVAESNHRSLRSATVSARNTPTGANACLPSATPRPGSAAPQTNMPQTSPTRPPAAVQQSAAPAAGPAAAPNKTAPPSSLLICSPADHDGAAWHETINLVSPSPGMAPIDLVVPATSNAELRDRDNVRSPAWQETSIPLSLLVSQASEAISASDAVTAATATLAISTSAPIAATETDILEDFPTLPSPGEEVMSPRSASVQARAKARGKHRQSRSPSPDREGVLSPIEATTLTIVHLGTALTDETLDGFFNENICPNPHLLAELEIQVAASIDCEPLADILLQGERDIDEQEQMDLQQGIQASLGLNPGPTNDTRASGSRCPGGSGSPPKRPRFEVSGTARATCATSDTALLAATAAAQLPPTCPATAAAAFPATIVIAAAAGGTHPTANTPMHAPHPQQPASAPPVVHDTADGNPRRTYITPIPNPPSSRAATTPPSPITLTLPRSPSGVQGPSSPPSLGEARTQSPRHEMVRSSSPISSTWFLDKYAWVLPTLLG
ncbi:hypothetical protein B0H13DRAFT_1865224 [Mycena leptocephala]|nr:hypothetical protein B0H13DRAFT_1865224 [Mycena leptocephala]